MAADARPSSPGSDIARSSVRVIARALLAGALATGFGGGTVRAETPAGAVVAQGGATVVTTPPLSAYRGPAGGPRARPPAPVIFVAVDLSDGDIATVARGVQQAAAAIGWPLTILDGQGTTQGQAAALESALRTRPGGIILGGFDASEQQPALRQARAEGIPVVGWHAAARPGPDPDQGLFTNVGADPAQLAQTTAQYVTAGSKGSPGVVIFTDPQNAFDTAVSNQLTRDMAGCRRCSVLQVIDAPVATAAVLTVSTVASLLELYGGRIGYLLTMNDAYIEGARIALADAGRSGAEPPFSVSVGGGDEAEFSSIRAVDYQRAAVAEPLNLEGWQLIDELNRARAKQPPSDYVPPPILITRSDVPKGASFDPASGYQKNYLHIWGR
jgi:ribose transport system substrate-binding protein